LFSIIHKNKNNKQEGTIRYESLNEFGQIALNLNLEIALRTKDTEKSPQLRAVERLLQKITGLDEDTINFDVQDANITLNLVVTAYIDIVDISNTTLVISIQLHNEELIGVYYLGKSNKVYSNLQDLGFFQASLSGIDVIGIFYDFLVPMIFENEGIKIDGNTLGHYLDAETGLNAGDIVSDLLSSLMPATEGASNASYEGTTLSNMSTAALEQEAPQNASIGLVTGTDAPLLKVLFSNDELVLNPNMELIIHALGALLDIGDYELPQIPDIRIGLSLHGGIKFGLRVKLDRKGNYLDLGIPEGGLIITAGKAAKNYQAFENNNTAALDNVYGGLIGLNVGVDGNGGIGVNMQVGKLILGLVDSLSFSDFSIYLEKRNDYFFLRNLDYGPGGARWDFNDFGGSFMKNLGSFAGPGGYSTGPTAYSPMLKDYTVDGVDPYDNAFMSKGHAFDWVIDLGITKIDVGSLITTYEPIFFDNAYRRLRLQLNKTVTNKLEVGLHQLTAISNVKDSLSDTDDWMPMGTTIFIRNYQLWASLNNLLVLDLSGLISELTKWLVRTLLNLGGPIVSIIGTTIYDLVDEFIADAIAGWLGGLVGASGNPIRIGAIIDGAGGQLGSLIGGANNALEDGDPNATNLSKLLSLNLYKMLGGIDGANATGGLPVTGHSAAYGKITFIEEEGKEPVPAANVGVALFDSNGTWVSHRLIKEEEGEEENPEVLDQHLAVTNENGEYLFVNYPAGDYTVKFYEFDEAGRFIQSWPRESENESEYKLTIVSAQYEEKISYDEDGNEIVETLPTAGNYAHRYDYSLSKVKSIWEGVEVDVYAYVYDASNGESTPIVGAKVQMKISDVWTTLATPVENGASALTDAMGRAKVRVTQKLYRGTYAVRVELPNGETIEGDAIYLEFKDNKPQLSGYPTINCEKRINESSGGEGGGEGGGEEGGESGGNETIITGKITGVLVTLKDETLMGESAIKVFTDIAHDATNMARFEEDKITAIDAAFKESFVTDLSIKGTLYSSFAQGNVEYRVYDYNTADDAKAAFNG
ncbi:MAG: hypothetical protein J6R35_05405, partial [Clostridia bacterium]|nr:hypothetical protein [Clostridia bacterium]